MIESGKVLIKAFIRDLSKQGKQKFLRNLSAKYLPDRYSDNTNEERRNHLIMEEIYKKMSILEDIFENRCGTCSTPSQI